MFVKGRVPFALSGRRWCVVRACLGLPDGDVGREIVAQPFASPGKFEAWVSVVFWGFRPCGPGGDGQPACVGALSAAAVGLRFHRSGEGGSETGRATNAETGQRLRVVANFPDADRVNEAGDGPSAETSLVVNLNDPPTGAPVLSNMSPVVGDAVAASPGSIADADGLANVTFDYQWQQGGGATFVNIFGATGASFTPTDAQLGQQLRVRVAFTDNQGTAEQVFSAPTAAVVSARVAASFAPPQIVDLRVNATGISIPRAIRRSLASDLLVRFRVNGAATVRMDVRTAKGKGVLVRRFNRKVKKAGLVSFRWNLTNARNLPVANGRYRIVVTITNKAGATTFTRAIQVRQ